MARRPKSADPAPGSRADQSIKAWKQRVKEAEDLHDEWEQEFRCRELHSKYVGTHQWTEEEDPEQDKYYVNLFFSGVENRKPSLVFSVPRFEVKPRPARTDDEFAPADFRARLFQDTINTVAMDRRVGLLYNAMLALQDSFFRFGCVEVGLRGDVVDNPRAGRPMMRDDMDAIRDKDGKEVIEGDKLVADELAYVKRIPASNVLISVSNENDTERNDWVGYWTYVRKEDIQANPFYDKSARSHLEGDSRAKEEGESYQTKKKSAESHMYVKLYRIWDLRGKQKRVFVENANRFLLEEKYRILPLRFLKMHEILESWYPLPPTYNWLPQQRELNDVKETLRAHRRRFLRKYTVLDGKVDESELNKMESGEDGVYINVPRHDVIMPIPDAELGRSVHLSVPSTKEDFMLVSGVTGERQGVQEAETATQANIIDTNAKLRDMYSKQLVGRWMADIAYTLLLTLAEQGSLGIWVNLNVDKTSINAPEEAMEIAKAWRLINSANYEVDEIINYEMDLDLDTLSPSQDARDRESWLQMMGLMVDPMMALHLLASDTLLRKTLRLHGVTKEREIMEVKKAMGQVQQYMIMREMLAMQGIVAPIPADWSKSGRPTASGLPPQPGPGQTGPGATPQLPSPQNTQNQIAGQVPGGVPGGQA